MIMMMVAREDGLPGHIVDEQILECRGLRSLTTHPGPFSLANTTSTMSREKRRRRRTMTMVSQVIARGICNVSIV